MPSKVSFKIFFLGLVILQFHSCGNTSLSQRIELIFTDQVYTSQGNVDSYKIDENKPHVVTYISGVRNIDFLYSHTPYRKINRIIEENEGWNFIFYVEIDEVDIPEFLKRLSLYDIDYPVIVDFEGNFRKKNFTIVKNFTLATMFVDSNNKMLPFMGRL